MGGGNQPTKKQPKIKQKTTPTTTTTIKGNTKTIKGNKTNKKKTTNKN